MNTFPQRLAFQCFVLIFLFVCVLTKCVLFIGKVFHCTAHVVASQDTRSVSNTSVGASCLWPLVFLSSLCRIPRSLCMSALPGTLHQPLSCQGLTKAPTQALPLAWRRIPFLTICLWETVQAPSPHLHRQAVGTSSPGATTGWSSNQNNHLLILLTICVAGKCAPI